MAVAVVNIRALRNEELWLPDSLDDAIEVRRALASAGIPDQQVSAMVGWLVAKRAGDPDQTTPQTRSRYRKVLAELQSPLAKGTSLRSDCSVPVAA